jgi:glucose-6-phosphate isomerase
VQTRNPKLASNPALLLAVAWHLAGEGQGKRALVVLPYKDRLELFGRYLQQLVMESLGKARDLSGATVHQGLTVYGNKGSTDQHAYVQQLREGPDDCFVTFLAVRKDRRGASREVEPGITSGDYLHGFWLGTRAALTEAGRRSVSLVLDCLTPRTLGALIALFERTVGYYAELIGINAYHQPGVEAGKVAANEVLQLQQKLLGVLRDRPAQNWSAETLAETLGQPQSVELVFHLLEHLAANQRLLREAGQTPFDAKFRITAPATPA